MSNYKRRVDFDRTDCATGEPNPAPWNNYPATTIGYDQQQPDDPSGANQSGLWGWISNNKMLATVVEKAKVINSDHDLP